MQRFFLDSGIRRSGGFLTPLDSSNGVLAERAMPPWLGIVQDRENVFDALRPPTLHLRSAEHHNKMTAPIPKPLADVVLDQMGEFITELAHYLPEDDPHLKAWDVEINRFLASHPAHAQIAMARMACFQGDIENAEHYLERALEKGASQMSVWDNALNTYSNLLFATRAQAVARKLVGIENANITKSLPSVVACGGASMASKLLEQARKAGLNMNTVAQISSIREIAAAFQEAPAVDEKFAAVIDCAGEVLRQRKLFWLEPAPRFRFDPGTGCFGIRYRVAVTPDEAAKMTVETADLLIARSLQDVPITIGFTGVRL